MAAVNGYVDMVKLLLEFSAKVTAKDENGNTPLHYAAFKYFSSDINILPNSVIHCLLQMSWLTDQFAKHLN